ncbi:MAG: hypothetical protein H8E53_03950, partial [Planctomycetes bacterium]|nr:hypothetical protein [Planctomycetota bacterium]
MRNIATIYLSLLIVVAVGSTGAAGADEIPGNLAPKAKVTASSRFSGEYSPAMAINGGVPGGDWA